MVIIIFMRKGAPHPGQDYIKRGIAALWEEISVDFEVYGLKDNEWQEFAPYKINYDAFLVKRR